MILEVLLAAALLQAPQDLYKAARADMDGARWNDAIAKFEQILKDDPTHIPSEFDLAVCYTKLGNPAEAEKLYRKILEQDAEVYEARMNLAILLADTGNTVAADEQFEKAAGTHPKDPQPLLYRAHLLEKRGDSMGAAENYERAIALNPADPEARLAAGLLYLRLQKPELARTHLEAAEDAGGKSPQLFIALSEALHLQHDEEGSAGYLEKALMLDPGNTNLRRQLAIVYRDSGDLDKAIDALKPAADALRLDLALAFYDSRNYADAAPLLEKLAAAEPANADFWYMLGKSRMELKQFADSVPSVQRAIQLKPDYSEAFFVLGWDFYELENWSGSIAAMEHYAPSKPRQAFTYFVIAICYDKLGNARQALLNYNKFSELDDGSNDARSFQARERAKTLARRLNKSPG